MNKLKWWQGLLILAFILLAVAGAILSIMYDIANNNNAVTMLAGLWSAVATVFLGGIAIWQNKRYKEMSDKKSYESEKMQEEIRALTRETMIAIDQLRKIEIAKLYPNIETMPSYYLGMTKKTLKEALKSNDVKQLTIMNSACGEAPDTSIESYFEKYNSFSFVIKNIGESTIKEFNTCMIKISGENLNPLFFFGCDISPGQSALISIIDFPQYTNGKNYDIEMKFKLQNALLEKFYLDLDIIIVFDKDDEAPRVHILDSRMSKANESVEDMINGQA